MVQKYLNQQQHPAPLFHKEGEQMKAIILFIIVYLISSIAVRTITRIRHARTVKRIRDEIQQREQEAKQIRQALKMQKVENEKRKLESQGILERMIEIEREQIELRELQRKQAEQISRQEERIVKLEFQMKQATADIEAEAERISALYALMDIAAKEQAGAVPGSKADVRAQKQILSLNNQIHAAERRKAKAEFTKMTARQKLSAA